MTHSKVVWCVHGLQIRTKLKKKWGGMGKRFKYYRRQSFDGTRSRAGHPQTNEYCNQLVECRLNSKPLVPPGCAI